jgi:hypothetical protein
MSLLEDEDKDNRTHNWLLYIGIILFIVLVVGAGWSILNKKIYDSVTLCEEDVMSATTVLLIDKTGGFSPNQKRVLLRAIEAEIEKLETGKRLTVYEIDDGLYEGLSKPVFDRCRPKDGSDVNQLVENKYMIEKSFNEDFISEIQLMIANLDETIDAKSSPIIESLSDISILYKIDPHMNVERLIVISDLLQHSPNISFYKNDIEGIEIDDISSFIPDLFGIDVQIYWLQREKNEQIIQNSGLIYWWERTFEAATINNLSIMKIR